MEEVCGVGLKNLRANFRFATFSRHQMFLVISWCRKTLVYQHQNQIISGSYFEYFLVCLYELDVFLYVPGIWINTSLFYSIAGWPKV